MKIKLSLLENSLDFLKESLDHYVIANERGEHHHYHSDYSKKIKWKMAFINLVQAIELLMKEIISRISPALIQSNIDSFANEDKSISFTQCITRLVKFSNVEISDEDINHLKSCAKLRNKFTHYNVSVTSEEIKKKYSSLLELYVSLYHKSIENKIPIEYQKIEIIKSVLTFAEQYTIFRGYEILKTNVTQFKKNINDAQLHTKFIDKNNNIVERIRFGQEEEFHKNVDKDNNHYIPSVYLWDYCDDCFAKQGEYHLLNCDLEKCPICNNQAISCECKLKWAEI